MGSLPPFVSSCADPHRGGETSKPLAASLDDRVTPTRVGKDQDGIRPRLRQSGHPHLRGEISGCGFDGSTGLVGV